MAARCGAFLGALLRRRHHSGGGAPPWRFTGAAAAGEISISPLLDRNALGISHQFRLLHPRFSSISTRHARIKPEDYNVHAWTDTPYLEYIVGLEPEGSTPATSTGGAMLGSITTEKTRPHPGYSARLITLRLENTSSFKAREAILDEKSYMRDHGRFWIPLVGDLLGGARHFHSLEMFAWMKDHKTVMKTARWMELERLYSMMISYAGVVGDAMLARKWFDEMEQRGMRKSTSCCNALIIAYAKDSDINSALAIFNGMKFYSRECPPNSLTHYILISMFARSERWPEMEQAIAECKSSGFKLDRITYITLLHAYARMGRRELFEGIYREMENAFVTGGEEGGEGFKPEGEVFTALIIGYSRLGALEMLQPTIARMKAAEVELAENITVQVAEEMAKAFSRSSTSEGLEEVIRFVEEAPGMSESSAFQSYLMEAYVKSGKLEEAGRLFEGILEKRAAFVEPPALDLLIQSFCKEGLVEKISDLCRRARDTGFNLAASTYELLVSELAKAGSFEMMDRAASDMEAAGNKWTASTLEALSDAYTKMGNTAKLSVVSRRLRRLQAEIIPEETTVEAAAAAC